MITLINANNQDIEFPDNAAIVSDPPYGISNNCNYKRFKGIIPSTNFAPVEGDDQPFDPSRWLTFPFVALFGFQFFADRLPVGSTLVWNKKRDNQLGRTLMSDCEIAWMNRGSGSYLFNHVWNGFDRASERGQKTKHPTQKPVAVMKWLIEKLDPPKDSVIVDPFCGSGSTLMAAEELGFDSIGVELSESYCGVTEQRARESRTHLVYVKD